MFSKNKSKRDWYSDTCKECNKMYLRDYYSKNKSMFISDVNNRKYGIRKWYHDLLSSMSCSICGYNKCISALEFHHIDNDKERNICDMVHRWCSKDSILVEMSKCSILCANCHREITAKQFNWYR